MLTGRGYWFIATLLFVAAPMLLFDQLDAARLALAFSIWMGLYWILFAFRTLFTLKFIRVAWKFDDEPVNDRVVWSGRLAKIKATIRTSFRWSTNDVICTLLAPSYGGFEGNTKKVGSVSYRGIEIEASYQAIGPAIVRLEGAHVEIADYFGLFSIRRFLRQPLELVLLAPQTFEHAMAGTLKRINALATYGQHRHLRPGSGSDLLNLRDYQEGDPPKSIAWKISAKRNRLITKEYESEVPVRCTAFVDASNSARMGPVGETLLSRAGRIVVPLAQKLISGKDPVGLCLFNEVRAISLPPRAAHWQVTRMQHSLLAAAKLPVKPVACSIDLLTKPLLQLCGIIYPELLDRSINSPEPWYRRMKIFSVRGIIGFSLAILIGIVSGALLTGEAPRAIIIIPIAYTLGAAILAWLIFPRVKSTHSSLAKSKQCVAIVAAANNLGPGGISLLSKDERTFSLYAQEMLNKHQVDYERPMFDERGNSLLESPAKIGVLAKALVRAIAHCQDNELFVLFVDLVEQADHRHSLIQAIRVAISRHHQVMVVVTWPNDLPIPGADFVPNEREMQLKDLSLRIDNLTYTTFLLRELSMKEHYNRYIIVRDELTRLGVPMMLVTDETTRAEILGRMERLRRSRVMARG